MITDTASRKLRRICLATLITTSVLFGLSLIPAVAMIIMSPMAFDSGQTATIWRAVLLLCAYPFVVIAAIAGSWILFALRRYKFAIWLSLLPLLDIAVFVAHFDWTG
jgi:hypothetical protein